MDIRIEALVLLLFLTCVCSTRKPELQNTKKLTDRQGKNYGWGVDEETILSDELLPELLKLTTKPKIEIIDNDAEKPWIADWDYLKLENNETSVIAKHKDNLFLNLLCSAPYEIQWIYENEKDLDNKNSETSEIRHFKEFINGSLIYKRTLSIRFEQNMTYMITQARCEHLYTYFSKSTINIFVPGNTPLIQRGKYAYAKNLKNHGIEIGVPCITSDPRIPVSLFSENLKTGIKEKIINTEYGPIRGLFFLRNKTQSREEVYICSVGDTEYARLTLEPVEEEEPDRSKEEPEVPQVENVLFLKLEDVVSRCEGTEYDFISVITSDGLLQIPPGNKTNILKREAYPNCKATDPDCIQTVKVAFSYVEEFRLSVLCVKEDTNLTTASKEGQVLKLLYTECDMSNTVVTTGDSYYTMSKEGTADGNVKWKEVNSNQLVSMLSKQGTTMNTDELSHFACMYPKSLYLSYGIFRMEMRDGSQGVLNNETFRSFKLGVSGTFSMSTILPIDAVAITCEVAFHSDPYLYARAERRFQTIGMKLDEFPPSIDKSKKINMKVFKIGKYNQKLFCNGIGEPKPVYHWQKDGLDLQPSLQIVKYEKMGESSLLDFPPIQKHHEGTYTCIVTNRLGSDSYNITVSVQDRNEKQVSSAKNMKFSSY